MKLGRYGGGNTKFENLIVKKLPMYFFNTLDYSQAGCGATALSLLTGINPYHSSLIVKNRDYKDSFMLKFLRKHKISAYEVNKANLTNQKELSYKIKDNCVILMSCLMKKKEASWMIFYNNLLFHNFEITTPNAFSFLNFPIDSMYVLYKKEWSK